MINNIKNLAQNDVNGYSRVTTWRKNPTQTTSANQWFDLSMSPGNPAPNYYIGTPNEFVPLAQSSDGGLPHRVSTDGSQEFLRTMSVLNQTAAAAPIGIWLLDYLGFYPFVDESNTDEQPFITTMIPVDRAVGGVQLMPVVVGGHSGVGSSYQVRYTNQDGVTGRLTPPHALPAQTVNGTIASGGAITNSRAPFMCLEDGDTAVMIPESIQFLTADVGLIALALVKPIAFFSLRENLAPYEKDFFIDSALLPEIKADAYLNLVACPNGNIAGSAFHGYIKTVWG
jgi:hypothetical protein